MLHRCYNEKCADKPGRPGHDFEDPAGKCDRCGVDPTDARHGGQVVKLTIVHLELPSDTSPRIGSGKLACGFVSPKVQRRTSEAAAVSCPACKASAEFATVKAAQSDDVHPDYNVDYAKLATVNAPAEGESPVVVSGGGSLGGK